MTNEEQRPCTGDCGDCAQRGGCVIPELHLKEEQISSEEVYNGRIIRVTRDTVRLENGSEAVREVVHHPGGACVVPLTDDGQVLMVRQFRYPHGSDTLEVPAGKLEYGEDPLECGIRELSEETGLRADEFVDLGAMCTSPGFSTEVLHIYLALGLHPGKSHPDEGEFLNVEKFPLQDLVKMVMDNQIDDGKTIAAVLKADRYLRGKRA